MKSAQVPLLKRYISRGQKEVEGWLTPGAIELTTDIDQAQQLLGIKGGLCEIGVHHGRFLILMYLLARRDENVIALDLFEQQDLNPDKSGEGNLEIVLDNLRTHAKDLSRLRILSTDSQQINAADIELCAEGKIRLISVDGGHRSEVACHDLITAANSLGDGGVVILDDYFNEEWPGVSEGTNAFFARHNTTSLAPFAIGGNKVFLTTASYGPKYQELLSGRVISTSFVRREFFGYPVLCYGFRHLTLRRRLTRTYLQRAYALRKKMSKTHLWKRIRETGIGRFISGVLFPMPSGALLGARQRVRRRRLAWSLATLGVLVTFLVALRPSSLSPQFGAAMGLRAIPRRIALAAGDFDHDGRLDFAVSGHDSADLILFLGDGRGGFRRAATVSAVFPTSEIAAADFNGDGRLDVAIAHPDAAHVNILLGDSQGGLHPAPESPIFVGR